MIIIRHAKYLKNRLWHFGLIITVGLIYITGPVSAAATPTFRASVQGPDGWARTSIRQPGEYTQFLMTYHNLTGKLQRQVSVTANPPLNAVTDMSSIKLFNPAHTDGTKQFNISSDGRGVRLGILQPGATAYVQYGVTLPPATSLSCGDNTLYNTMTAVVPETSKNYSDTVTIVVHRDCPAAAPATTIKPTMTVKPVTTQQPTTSSTVTTPPDNSQTVASVSPTTSAAAADTIDAPDAAAAEDTGDSTSDVAATTAATTLPNTGSGNILGLFAGVIVIGTVSYYFWLRRLLHS